MVGDLNMDVAGLASVSGRVGLAQDSAGGNDTFKVVGSNISARAGTGDLNVSASGANFG